MARDDRASGGWSEGDDGVRESEEPAEPTYRLPSFLTWLYFPIAIVDTITWLTARHAWGCEWAIDNGEPCDGAVSVDHPRFDVSLVLFVFSYAPVIRLFWTERVRDRRRRILERVGLVLTMAALQVGPIVWLWWGAPDL